jgi:hypothetical protein
MAAPERWNAIVRKTISCSLLLVGFQFALAKSEFDQRIMQLRSVIDCVPQDMAVPVTAFMINATTETA